MVLNSVFKTTLLSLSVALAAGCASDPQRPAPVEKRFEPTPGDRAAYISAREKAVGHQLNNVQSEQLRRAYERGARDVLEDFKGRMRAQSTFVYEPPVVDYVEMPAQVVNGALRPRHKTPVIYRKGRWQENNGVLLPDIER